MNQEHLEHRRDVIKEELAAKNQQLASYREERKAMGDQVRDAVKPVSYTHLDVYKRQPYIRMLYMLFFKFIRCNRL